MGRMLALEVGQTKILPAILILGVTILVETKRDEEARERGGRENVNLWLE